MTEEPMSSALAEFIAVMPPHMLAASKFCALPHWFDGELGIEIVKHFLRDIDSPENIFSELLNQPFVYPHGTAWQYTSRMRTYFCNLLAEEQDLFKELNAFLVNYFRQRESTILQQNPTLTDEGFVDSSDSHLQARRFQWQIAYHLAPLDARDALRQLLSITNDAQENPERSADVKIVLDVWRDQDTYFSKYRAEGAYLEGFYAYLKRDISVAEDRFSLVWQEDTENPLTKANAGRLLAVIRRQKGTKSFINDSETLLRSSYAICREAGLQQPDVKKLVTKILNSLAATLIQKGNSEALSEAEEFLRHGLELSRDLDENLSYVHLLNTFGIVLTRTGRHKEAESSFREALEIGQRNGYARNVAVIQSSLADLLSEAGEASRLVEVEQLLRDSLTYAEEIKDNHQLALVLNKLGEVLLKMDNLPEAQKCFQSSFELWKNLNNPQGQFEAVSNMADLREKQGYLPQALKLRKQAAIFKKELDL